MRILVLGVTGMLGNAMFRVLTEVMEHEVYGTARSNSGNRHLGNVFAQQILNDVDVENYDSLVHAFAVVRPQVVVNCIGLVKQLASVDDPLRAIPLNSLLPHRLASLCFATGARLVHFSTDCVFSGAKGGYQETDFPDARDLYGRTKLLGEVDRPDTITLRTSIIGHELSGNRSLIGWFLAQEGPVNGFSRVIFSGLPTVELSRVVRDVVLPRPELHGIYHVGSSPISKYELLHLVADVYGKTIEIVLDEQPITDRSLNTERFREATGYVAPTWPVLVKGMYEFQ